MGAETTTRTGPDGTTWRLLPRHDGSSAWFRAGRAPRSAAALASAAASHQEARRARGEHVSLDEAIRVVQGRLEPHERIALEAVSYREFMRSRGEEVSTADAVAFTCGRMPEAESLARAASAYREQLEREGRAIGFSEAVHLVRRGLASFAELDPHAAHARAMAHVRKTFGLPDEWVLGETGWEGQPAEYGDTWREQLELEFARAALAVRLHKAAEVAAGRKEPSNREAMVAADDLLDGRSSEGELAAAVKAHVATEAARGVTVSPALAARIVLARLEPATAEMIRSLPPVAS